MDLLTKFSAVTIEADTRISASDRAFCLRQQEAFDKSGPALQRIVDVMRDADAQLGAIFAEAEGDGNDYLSSQHGFHLDVDSVYETMKARNKKFIQSIVSYFSRTYTVKLDVNEILEHLIPAAPKEPPSPCRWYRDMTDEEAADYHAKLDAYKIVQADWEQTVRTLPLRYEQVVDEIFTQLGGFSFQEQAMNEFLDRTWRATHYTTSYSWNNIQEGQEKFEIKKAVLTLQNAVYYHSEFSEFRPYDELKSVLEALAYYECGRMNEGDLWFPELFRYDTQESFFNLPHMSKVESIKLFKNGRVDIRFRDAAFAQEFADQCLRVRPNTMCA